MANTYLTKTFSSGGNQRIWTLSFWVKLNRGTGEDNYILTYAQGSGATPRGSNKTPADERVTLAVVKFEPTSENVIALSDEPAIVATVPLKLPAKVPKEPAEVENEGEADAVKIICTSSCVTIRIFYSYVVVSCS